MALQLLLNFLLSLAVLGAVAAVLLRSRRKARSYDIAIWIAAGVALTVAFHLISTRFSRGQHVLERSLSMLWIVVFIGAVVSFISREKPPGSKRTFADFAVVLLVAIVFVVLFVVPPATQEARWGVAIPPCRRNLRDISIAMYTYHDRFDTLPAQAAGEPAISWRVELLPYLKREDLRNRYDVSQPWDSAANLSIARQQIPTYTCPNVYPRFRERDGLHFTSYAVVVGPHTYWQGDQSINLDSATDGDSNTLLVVEACGQQIIWTEPRDIELATTPVGVNLPGDAEGRSSGAISSYHTGGAYGVFADGHSRYISSDIDPAVLEALMTADGGEEIGEF